MNSRLFQNFFRPGHTFWALFGVLVYGCLASDGLAQTNSAHKSTSSGNRYLVIFENSKVMANRVHGATRSLEQIINSGFKGQVRRGDSLGVWTYNDQLYTGKFPLQELSPETLNATASAVTTFVTQQKCEKQPHFDKVLPSLQRVIGNSELLTILIISTGTEDIQGTPFDDAINANYNQWRSLQQQEHMPFVTLLRVQRGQITQHAVAPAPWPADLPALSAEPAQSVAKAKPVAPPPAPKPTAAKPSTGALVFSGKKAESTVAPANSVVPTNEPGLRAALPTLTASTNASASAALPLVPASSSAVTPQPSNAVAASQPSKQDATPTAPKVTSPAPTEIAAAAPVQPRTLLAPAESTITNAPKTNALGVAAGAAPPTIPKSASAAAVEKPKISAISEPVKTGEVSTRNPVQPATGESLFSTLASIWLRVRLVLAAVVFVFVAWWFVVNQRRRARESARPISLITRSLDTRSLDRQSR